MGTSSSKSSDPAPLVQAALIKDVEAVTKLIEGGEDVNNVDAGGNHGLGAAACSGSLEIVDILLKASAPVNLKNGMECSPLWLAAGYGHLEVLTRLIDAGGNPNDVNNTNDSPMVAAAFKDKFDCVERLLNHPDIDITLANKNQDTVFSIAASRGKGDILEKVLELVPAESRKELVNRVNAKGVAPLNSAAAFGELRAVKCLLDNGAGLDKVDMNGATPLMVSSHCGHHSCVEAILACVPPDELQTYLEIGDEQGATALWLASVGGFVDTVKVLLAAGADPLGGSPGGLTAKGAAEKNGHTLVSELLQ